MKIIKIRMLLLLFSCLVGVSANSQFINSQAESDCGIILMGGSYYNQIDPDHDPKSLYAYDLNDDPVVRRKVYPGSFDRSKLSLSCGYIAFIETSRVQNVGNLRVITYSGQEKLLLPGVLWFDWGTNAAKEDLLAYLVGSRPAEEGLEGRPAGEIWILNVRTNEQWKIHPTGNLVIWAEFDSSFYIEELHDEQRETRVTRYDCESKELKETSYLGTAFSRGGTYYYLSDYDIGGFRLFERTDNIEITQKFSDLYKHLTNGLLNPVGWISDSMLVLQSKHAREEGGRATQQIIDFKKAQLWEVDSEVIGLSGQGGRELVQLTKGQVTVRPFSDVAKLIYPVPEGSEAAKTTATEKKAE